MRIRKKKLPFEEERSRRWRCKEMSMEQGIKRIFPHQMIPMQTLSPSSSSSSSASPIMLTMIMCMLIFDSFGSSRHLSTSPSGSSSSSTSSYHPDYNHHHHPPPPETSVSTTTASPLQISISNNSGKINIYSSIRSPGQNHFLMTGPVQTVTCQTHVWGLPVE